MPVLAVVLAVVQVAVAAKVSVLAPRMGRSRDPASLLGATEAKVSEVKAGQDR